MAFFRSMASVPGPALPALPATSASGALVSRLCQQLQHSSAAGAGHAEIKLFPACRRACSLAFKRSGNALGHSQAAAPSHRMLWPSKLLLRGKFDVSNAKQSLMQRIREIREKVPLPPGSSTSQLKEKVCGRICSRERHAFGFSNPAAAESRRVGCDWFLASSWTSIFCCKLSASFFIVIPCDSGLPGVDRLPG